MKEIKIKLYSLRELWMKYQDRLQHEADKMSEENLQSVRDYEKNILYHIAREPIPKENKEYLSQKVHEELLKVWLHPVWPRKSKK